MIKVSRETQNSSAWLISWSIYTPMRLFPGMQSVVTMTWLEKVIQQGGIYRKQLQSIVNLVLLGWHMGIHLQKRRNMTR